MSVPRDHHFIPAFFLEQWAGPDGKLIEYTIKHGKLVAKPVGPRSTGFETDLYAFPELPPETAQYIEQKFWDYADRVAAQAHEMHLGVVPGVWDAERRTAWSRFVLGIHMRHPDAMSELRAGMTSIWDAPAPRAQAEYEKIKQAQDPTTFDERLAQLDPLVATKMTMNLVITAFDNETVGQHINEMSWSVVDVSAAPHRLLLSDRPVEFGRIKEPTGSLSMPIGPTKLFMAVNDPVLVEKVRSRSAKEVVAKINAFTVARARRFVWAQDRSQDRFVENRMSSNMEPTPLLPSIGLPETAGSGEESG